MSLSGMFKLLTLNFCFVLFLIFVFRFYFGLWDTCGAAKTEDRVGPGPEISVATLRQTYPKNLKTEPFP